jgi:hypothetical protein
LFETFNYTKFGNVDTACGRAYKLDVVKEKRSINHATKNATIKQIEIVMVVLHCPR